MHINRTLDGHNPFFKVNIPLLQPEQFAGPQAGDHLKAERIHQRLVDIIILVKGKVAADTNLPLKGRKDLRGIIVPDKAEDAGGLAVALYPNSCRSRINERTPGKDDNAVWRNKTCKAFDDLTED